jgi:aspartate aminotransferase
MMPGLSRRGLALPPSPIRKLVPFAEDAKRRGIHVYHINIGQPDIESPVEFLQAFRESEMKLLPYGHSAGLWEYRDSLVHYYQRHSIELTSEEIVVTTGGSEAITFAMMAVADSGDEIIVPEPFYTNYNGFAVEAGVKLVPVTCRVEDGFRLPPPEAFESLRNERTRAVLVCNPNNPTGHVLSADEIAFLGEFAVRHDLHLLSDEVYREFVYDGAVARSVLNLEGAREHAVMLDSISKRYSVCGARVGCVATHNRDILRACLRMGQARLCPPTMEQIAAGRAVYAAPAYLEEVVREYQARRDAVFEEIESIPGVVALRPSGAFYTVARLPVEDADDFARWLLEEYELDGETVMLAPANGFYATPGMGKDEVRIAFVLAVPAMRRSMEILRRALDRYPGATP